MSSRTPATWAKMDGTLVHDSNDTCVIRIDSSGVVYLFSVDMKRGVIEGYYKQSLAEQIFQRYIYGCHNGIYYLRKLTNSPTDTTIKMGGYRFYDIRLNGESVAPVTYFPGAPARRLKAFRTDAKGHATLTIAGNDAATVSLYDLLSRSLFRARFAPGTHRLDLEGMCRNAACPSGRLLLRVEKTGEKAYSTLFVR